VDNAYERTKLTADYSLAGLIGMASAGRLKKVTTSVGKNVSNINKRLVGRMEIISEREIVSKAASMPGEWNGQFKLVREIQPVAHGNEFASNVYCREVVFKDPKSGQMFRAFQRNDIDPNYVVRSGDYAGHKNLELMSRGLAPYTSTDEQVIIHHMGQNAFGPFVEVTKTTHKSFLHNQFGYKQLHPTAPVIRSEFNPIRQAYWRAYAESFK
jgi:hypothetical protein